MLSYKRKVFEIEKTYNVEYAKYNKVDIYNRNNVIIPWWICG